MGFFLPVPPVAGGATEKSWHRLAVEFARRGHEVTIVSRCWPGWPAEEIRDGVRHLRLPGFDHTPHLVRNLARDARWSLRVRRKLPPADVTVVNSVTLPALPRWRRNVAGRLVVMTGRIPKGQFRLYRHVDRVLAVSTAVQQRIQLENPAVASRAIVTGYPIDCDGLARGSTTRRGPVTVGFIGRLHREKGLHLLADTARQLAAAQDLPPWRIVLCGPVDIARGGSGPDYVRALRQSFQATPNGPAVEFRDAQFNDAALAEAYREIDVFCYPSLAAQGETFGVAVAEAMAAGAVPVVSSLPCFRDYLQPGVNGDTFDQTAPDAAARLAGALAALLRNPERRGRMALAATASIRRFDVRAYADRLLADFSTLN